MGLSYLAPYFSQKQNATMSRAPMISGARVCAEDHGYFDMSALPLVDLVRRRTDLIATPLQPSHEEDKSADAQEASNIVDFLKNLHLGLAQGVDARRREIEE
jgi:hypothetical protein